MTCPPHLNLSPSFALSFLFSLLPSTSSINTCFLLWTQWFYWSKKNSHSNESPINSLSRLFSWVNQIMIWWHVPSLIFKLISRNNELNDHLPSNFAFNHFFSFLSNYQDITTLESLQILNQEDQINWWKCVCIIQYLTIILSWHQMVANIGEILTYIGWIWSKNG